MSLHIVVEDPGLRDSLSVLLALQGFVVEAHANGSSLRSSGVLASGDVVILDLDLPGGEARPLIDWIGGGAAGCRLIVLSGHGNARFGGSAASSVLAKPFDANDLLALVGSATARDMNSAGFP